MKRTFFYIVLLLSLSSCFEIIEEMDLKENQSGTFTYTINLSQSKLEMNSFLKLDSVMGMKIPSKYDIKSVMNDVKYHLIHSKGISKVDFTENWEEYIFTYKIQFDSLPQFTRGMEETYRKLSDHNVPLTDRFIASSDTVKRLSNLGTVSFFRRLDKKYIEGLGKANYTCVYRFDRPVKVMSNTNSVKSKNGKAVMLRSNMKKLLNKESTLKNKITF